MSIRQEAFLMTEYDDIERSFMREEKDVSLFSKGYEKLNDKKLDTNAYEYMEQGLSVDISVINEQWNSFTILERIKYKLMPYFKTL